jgi:protoporphyrinogen/coproporphyrinogen III oxidase
VTAAIVGGGVAGLALARELVRAGREVVVLEAAARPGGLLETVRQAGFLCESGANAFLEAEGGAADLCRSLGVELTAASPAAKTRYIYRGGRRHALAGPPTLLGTDLLSLRGKLRLLAEPLIGKSAEPEPTVDAFFRRRLGREAAEALIGPFVLGVFAGESDRLSMPAAFPRVWELEQEHGGLVRGMLARRKQGAARPKTGLVAPVGGAGAIVDALARELGERVQLNARVTRIERGWKLFVGEREIRADRLVLAAPAKITSALLAPLDPELARLAAGINSAPVVLAFAGFAEADLGAAKHGFGLLVARGERPRVLGVVFESTLWPGRAPAGQGLLRLIYGGARDPGALQLSDDELRRQVADDLAATLDLRATPSFFHVARQPVGIPQYEQGHAARVKAAESAARHLGVTLAGNAWRAVAVNDLVRDAQRLAAELAA